MKFSSYLLASLILLSAGTAATDDRSRGVAVIKPEKPKVKSQAQRPYTFDDYMNDLKTSARKDEPKPAGSRS